MDNNGQNNIAGAITFPSRNEEPVPVQPRQPRNLQGLLRFAMEATQAEDAPRNSELGPMDEQRRKFLQDALQSLTIDVSEVLCKSIKVLSDVEVIRAIQLEDIVPPEVHAAFMNLLEFIDDIDIANDFYKIGGFAIFPVCYGSENARVRALASTVLAELCQNNPACQAQALESGLLGVLLHLAGSEQGSALAQCIRAISCVCREYEPATRALTAQGGCEALAAALRARCGPARTKAAFLVSHLCRHCPDAREKFVELNTVRIIAEELEAGRDESSEHLLSILLNLVKTDDYIIAAQCTDPGVGLRKILEDHLDHPDLKDDTFVEEKTYCQEILKVIDSFKVDYVNNEADR